MKLNKGLHSPIIVALDELTRKEALSLARRLQRVVWGFKVNDLLIEHGVSIISDLKRFGHVFADPKLHDIPNTVKNSISRLDAAGADLITVHASGGAEMLRVAAGSVKTARVLAVTALTSLSDSDTNSLYKRTSAEVVLDFAELAATSNVHGIVCSPYELTLLKGHNDLIKVIPGIRPLWYGVADDQKRIQTPAQAMAQGADLLVIGRPITGAEDPLEAANRINAELL